MQHHSFQCACGQVEFEAEGPPVNRLVCYCDDCQEGARRVETLPQGRSLKGADGGTPSTVFRKDKVRCVRGAELLVEVNVREGSFGHRLVSSCCNSALGIRYDGFFPLMPLRDHSAPEAEFVPDFRSFTSFAPNPTLIAKDAPHYARLPLGFLAKIIYHGVALKLSGARSVELTGTRPSLKLEGGAR